MGQHRESVAILGCGVLGTVIARGLQGPDAGHSFEVVATQRTTARAQELFTKLGIPCTTDNKQACEQATFVILAVRPQSMGDLLLEISPSLKPNTLCVSIAAGLPLRFYEERLPANVAVMRAHPSPMMTIGRGFIALSTGTRSGAAEVKRARLVFVPFCEDTLLIPEKEINLFAALFGSSAALLYLFAEAILSVEAPTGVPTFSPRKIITGMLGGAAGMLVDSNKSLRELSEEICTPGGMTIQGVREWQEHNLSHFITSAMEAVLRKAEEMSQPQN